MKKAPKRPKADKTEVEKRIRIVQEWLIDEWSTDDIVMQVKLKWGIDPRQAKRYVAEARQRWEKGEDERIDTKRRRKTESLNKLARSLEDQYKGTPAGVKAILAVQKTIIALNGLSVAKPKVEVDPNNQPIPPAENVKVMLYLPRNGREIQSKENAGS